MKLVVKQDNLAKALNSVSRIATAKAGAPILANVLIRTDGSKLIVAATNLEVAIVTTLGAQVEEEGALAVPAKLLTDFVNNLPHANISIESDDMKLKISAGDYKSTINCVVADDYPVLPEPTGDTTITIGADELKDAISGTALVTSNDLTRPILTGVYFYTADGQAYMAATDGYRLAESKLIKTDQQISAIIPSTTLMEVTRLIGDKKEVEIKYNDEQISFVMGGTSVISKLIDGRFIDYKQLIPVDTNFVITTDRSEFIKITKIAEIFARETAGSVIVEADPVKKTLNVRSITSQLGENSSSIEADVSASGDEDCMVSMNSKFLLDAMNCIEGDKITMRFNGKLSPVLLTGKNDNYLHLVMPVKS